MTTFLAACLAFSNVKAQQVNGVRLTEIKSDYLEISAFKPEFSSKIWIKMEYGQKAQDNDDMYIKDDNGKKLEFNSALDCVNKLKNYGYELFQVYSTNPSPQTSHKFYVLKRR